MSEVQKFIDDILFVIVLYETVPEACEAFKSLQSSSENETVTYTISFYDNSKLPQPIDQSRHHHTLYYHHNTSNVGLSTSYNHACAEAIALHKTWIFILDQDSSLPTNFYSAYFQKVKLFPEEILFAPFVRDGRGILSPLKFSWARGKRIRSAKSGLCSLQRLRPINTGMMIRVDAFRHVHGFEESIALDFSDFAFVEKIKVHYENFVIVDTVIQQEFFDSTATKEMAADRFIFYYKGALEMGHRFGPFWMYYYRIVARMAYLSFRFRSLTFLTLFLDR